MTWQMRDLRDDLVRDRWFDLTEGKGTGFSRYSKLLGEGPPPFESPLWCDYAPYQTYFYDRSFFHVYLPWGVYTIYGTFAHRMKYPKMGETKRGLKREIQSNPHLHPKLKAILLKQLVKASVHKGGWGLKEMDGEFCRRICKLSTREEAAQIRRDLENHTMISEEMRENLLFNLATYEKRLD